MIRCLVGFPKFATGVNIANAKGNPRILFTSCFTKHQGSCDCAFAMFLPASALESPTICSEREVDEDRTPR
jgi:hypothetical protein